VVAGIVRNIRIGEFQTGSLATFANVTTHSAECAMRVLVTGVAGFIGMHIAEGLLLDRCAVAGWDNLSENYDVELKRARVRLLQQYPNFSFQQHDIADQQIVQRIKSGGFDIVIHLAAQAGVVRSLENAQSYSPSNLLGFANILEGCRLGHVEHLIFASSSTVYGRFSKLPFTENDATDCPLNFYAATKKANEVMAYSYAHAHGLRITGLRLFSVYGPWGRPDMAYYLFAQKIVSRQTITLFNYGSMRRDYTYIADVVGVVRLLAFKNFSVPASKSVSSDKSDPYFSIYNIGSGISIKLDEVVNLLEEYLNVPAMRLYAPSRTGELVDTLADCTKLRTTFGCACETPFGEGVRRFVTWFEKNLSGACTVE
jgi:UDP-glucuronate 4-epimerase